MLPLGEAEGGHGVPFGLVPAVLGVVPGLLPGFGVEGEEPELDVLGFVEAEFVEPGFDDPGFVEPGFDDPAFGVGPFGIPGVTQGVPLGVVPGLFGVAVDGCAAPGVCVGGKFDPGIAPGVVALGGAPVGTPDPG